MAKTMTLRDELGYWAMMFVAAVHLIEMIAMGIWRAQCVDGLIPDLLYAQAVLRTTLCAIAVMYNTWRLRYYLGLVERPRVRFIWTSPSPSRRRNFREWLNYLDWLEDQKRN